MTDEIPKGRIRRGLALVRLAARELPMVGERLIGGGFGARDHVRLRESAENAAKILGDLRGLALKLGQTVSYVDGLLPPEATEIYQKALAKLQSAAPTVSFDQIRAEVERGLGRTLEEAFVRFDPTPVAAASIGQVHKAVLRDPDDGTEATVAVKVQYPGIAHALSSDLKNLEVLRPVIAMLAPGAETGKGMDEVVARLMEELDYHHEADNQDRFRALVEGYPDVVIPRVYRSHSARNVLTTGFVEGRSIRDIAEHGDQALRDRVGIAIFRFTLGTAFSRGVFNTDPHPGNYIVLDDGRVAFLDFGSVKFLPEHLKRKWRDVALAMIEGRMDDWRRLHAELLGMEHMDARARELNQRFMLQTSDIVARDAEITIDRSVIRSGVDEGIATAKQLVKETGIMPSRAKTVRVPPDLVMVGRMQLGLVAVLAQLRPRANWNRVLREMIAATG